MWCRKRIPVTAVTLLCASVSGLMAPGVFAGETLQVTKVAVLGDPAPGFGPVVFEAFGNLPVMEPFGDPVAEMGPLGHVAFHAWVGEDGIPDGNVPPSDPHGLFRCVDGVIELVVTVGDAAAGTPGAFIGFPEPDPFPIAASPMISGGRITFLAKADDFVGAFGLWTDRFGPLEFIVRDGDALPGMHPGQWVSVFAAAVRGENIYLNVRSSQATATEGLWRNRTGVNELIANEGLPAPGTDPGVTFGTGTSLAFFGPIDAWDANVNGHVVFNGYLDGPGIHEQNDEGVWATGPTGLELIAREGDPAPMAGPGVFFGSGLGDLGGLTTFNDSDGVPQQMNDRGSLILGPRLTSLDFFANSSVYTTRSGSLELVARGESFLSSPPNADPAPGLEMFNAFFGPFIFADINNQDVIVLMALAHYPGTPAGGPVGLWWDVSGELALIAANGLPAPGIPGAIYEQVLYQVPVGSTWEHVLFFGRISGPGIDSSNDFVLFRASPDGTVTPILREGGPVAIDEDLFTVTSFVMGPGESDAGERVFEMTFSDGTEGIFTASILPPVLITGDLNGDGIVNVNDLLLLLSFWGVCPGCAADLDGDGIVGITDLLILLANWG